jgi:hypothetical protein
MTTMRAIAGVLLLGVAAVSCGDGGTGPGGGAPVPGALQVTLDTPHADDGALLFTVTGAPVTTVTGGAGLTAYAHPVDSLTTRVVVLGAIADGPLVRLQVPDVNAVAGYAVRFEQAAARQSYAQRTAEGYGLTIARP